MGNLLKGEKMFKKILMSTVIYLGTLSMVNAKEVEVLWPFAIGGQHGNLIKSVVDSANKNQNDFKFVLTNKPGAGGSVATQSVLSSNKLIILAHAPAFWTRPLMFKEGWYDVDQFVPISIVCYNDPAVLVSKKFKTVDEMLKAEKLSVGINVGSLTSVVAGAAFNNFKSKVTYVPFKNTIEISTAVMGGHIDVGVDFLVGAINNPYHILGVTGPYDREGIKSFSNQGISGLENVTNTYFFLVRKDTDKKVIQQLSDIFVKAGQSEMSKKSCEILYGIPFNGNQEAAKKEYYKLQDFYKKLITDLNLEAK
jgi:tripartite-type tricarboxylate transporter receptor subunit TctC